MAIEGIGLAGMRVAKEGWSAWFLCFSYDTVYRPGAQNQAADCLSRILFLVTVEHIENPEMVAAVFSRLPSLSRGGFTAKSCPELSLLRTQILKG